MTDSLTAKWDLSISVPTASRRRLPKRPLQMVIRRRRRRSRGGRVSSCHSSDMRCSCLAAIGKSAITTSTPSFTLQQLFNRNIFAPVKNMKSSENTKLKSANCSTTNWVTVDITQLVSLAALITSEVRLIKIQHFAVHVVRMAWLPRFVFCWCLIKLNRKLETVIQTAPNCHEKRFETYPTECLSKLLFFSATWPQKK